MLCTAAYFVLKNKILIHSDPVGKVTQPRTQKGHKQGLNRRWRFKINIKNVQVIRNHKQQRVILLQEARSTKLRVSSKRPDVQLQGHGKGETFQLQHAKIKKHIYRGGQEESRSPQNKKHEEFVSNQHHLLTSWEDHNYASNITCTKPLSALLWGGMNSSAGHTNR